MLSLSAAFWAICIPSLWKHTHLLCLAGASSMRYTAVCVLCVDRAARMNSQDWDKIYGELTLLPLPVYLVYILPVVPPRLQPCVGVTGSLCLGALCSCSEGFLVFGVQFVTCRLCQRHSGFPKIRWKIWVGFLPTCIWSLTMLMFYLTPLSTVAFFFSNNCFELYLFPPRTKYVTHASFPWIWCSWRCSLVLWSNVISPLILSATGNSCTLTLKCIICAVER